MITLFFVSLVACIFVGVALAEAEAPQRLRIRPGLVGWVVSGNWPAKVGGALLMIGVGALLRYGLLHTHVPPPLKLFSGAFTSVALFAIAHWIHRRYARRDIAIALAGAAFGIAYLTAYSAYAFFNYLDTFIGVALLAIVAIGAGTYAITRKALSLAMLATLGAYLAPAFAVTTPSAQLVYGYYLFISQLVLVAVAIRQWRALGHLSFLFTVGGGVFFAWTADFFTPAHMTTLRPLLLIITAMHVAMPLVAATTTRSRWMLRFDRSFFLVLPLTAALSLGTLCGTTHDWAISLILLSAIWFAAAIALQFIAKEHAPRHAWVGVGLVFVGMYLSLPGWPWPLLGLFSSCAVLVFAHKMRASRTLQNGAVLSTLLFCALFFAATITKTTSGLAFINALVLERLIASLSVIAAGVACRKLAHPCAPILKGIGAIGLVNAAVVELWRLQIDAWPLVLHLTLIIGALYLALIARRRAVAKPLVAIVSTLAVWTAACVGSLAALPALMLAVVGSASLLTLALRSDAHETDYSDFDRLISAIAAPGVAYIWIRHGLYAANIYSAYLPLLAATVVSMIAYHLIVRSARAERWRSTVATVYAIANGVWIIAFTTLHIAHGIDQIALNIASLTALIQLAYGRRDEAKAQQVLASASVIGVALFAQSMLLRWLGPDRILSALDVFELQWPAVISLFWSALGAALTILARSNHSRTTWSIGATVLVGCAVKLVLFDFGSLGQLANILAVIAAGLMFLAVSWLAPLPPKEGINARDTHDEAVSS